MTIRILPTVVLALGWLLAQAAPNPPRGVRALSRQGRIDLVWEEDRETFHYQIERATAATGPFTQINTHPHSTPVYSDFVGEHPETFHYRIRGIELNDGRVKNTSSWSPVISCSSKLFNREILLTDVQEAAFRYFYDYGHPISGLARERSNVTSNPGWVSIQRENCSIGGTGMGMFTLITGIERKFITRQTGADRVLKILRFLAKADRFHGAFPHWLNGTTGKVQRFGKDDDGADLVETAFLAEGFIILRQYFTGPDAKETEIRALSDKLWREIEWQWFAHEKYGHPVMMWHWSPNSGWKKNLWIRGFNECEAVYLLALASPTHPVAPKYYWQGWRHKDYGRRRNAFGVELRLGNQQNGPPLFFTHYSYLGFDPRAITFDGKTNFQHFQDFCRVQIRYARSKRDCFKGYDTMWGLTASYDPQGYKPHSPTRHDTGTISPTAALSSMPYAPKDAMVCVTEMYEKHGKTLWGEFGFYDAFCLSRDWVASGYLAIDQGPIAPMIENHRTGLLWKRFMQAPEVQKAMKILKETEPR